MRKHGGDPAPGGGEQNSHSFAKRYKQGRAKNKIAKKSRQKNRKK